MVPKRVKIGLSALIAFTGFAILLWALISRLDDRLLLNNIEAIKARGELVFVTRNNTTCYFEGPHGPIGFEYDLAKAFADHLGVKLRPLIIEEEARMIEALRRGDADIIAAGIPFGGQSEGLISLGPGYLDIRQQVIGRRGGLALNNISKLSHSAIWMADSSARLEILQAIKSRQPGLLWKSLSDYSSEELLEMVWHRALPLTMVESHTMAVNRNYYPELVVHFTLGAPRKLAWALHPQSSQLQREVVRWFSKAKTQKKISGLVDYHFSHVEQFDYVDIIYFHRRIYERLPKYRKHFQRAAEKYGLDWYLVAAQSYQESHWNPKAKSFTGVRGIMMLTRATAEAMGLKDRLAVKESIFAGTRYLSRLHQRVGDAVPEPDRTLMALAAYNFGFSHLRDARILARRLGKPAHSWHGVRSVLPLLQQQEYYLTLPNGYARGNEALQYVDRIRSYHKVLIRAMHP